VTLLLWWLGGLSPTDALLQAGSAQTTTGFATLDLSELDPAAKAVLILSMATGGGAGSTAGGIKLLRLLILIRVIQLAVMRVNYRVMRWSSPRSAAGPSTASRSSMPWC
jgi:trk system potassium uptake protein